MKRIRLALQLLTTALVLILASAGSAGATTYCVGNVPLCSGVIKPGDGGGLASALVDAQASTGTADVVMIASGSYAHNAADGFAYNDAPGDSIEIVGQGEATQIIGIHTNGKAAMTLNFNSSSSLRSVRFGPSPGQHAGSYADLRVEGGTVRDVLIDGETSGAYWDGAIAVSDPEPTTLKDITIRGSGLNLTHGVWVRDGSTVSIDRARISGVTEPIEMLQSVDLELRNSLIDLGSLTAVAIRNDLGDSNAISNLLVDHTTIVGSGTNSVGLFVQGHPDYDTPPYSTANVLVKNSIIDLRGAGSLDLNCPTDGMTYSTEHVSLSHVAWNPAQRDDTMCNVTAGFDGSLTMTGMVDRTMSPLLLDASFKPTAGSSAIDAGEPSFVAQPGELDLAGNARVSGAAVDLGAYEFAPSSLPQPGGDQTQAPLTLKFGKTVGKLRVARKPKALKRGTKKSKPRIPITLSAAATVTLKLAPKPKSKKKKAKNLKGSVKLKLPVGTSYLAWSGKWGKKKLKPGNYVLTATAPGLAKPVTLKIRFRR